MNEAVASSRSAVRVEQSSIAAEPWRPVLRTEEAAEWSASPVSSRAVLGKEVHAAADPSSGPLLLEGRAPLVAGGLQTVPTGASRFPRTERVYFYTEVYDPLLAANNPPAFSLQFRVLDLGTGEVKQDSGITRAPTYKQAGTCVI